MKISLEEAKEIAKKLKAKYKFGQVECPKWFVSVCNPMEQDGSFGVSICIPSWNAVPQADADVFFEPFEGIHISMRVVTPPNHDYNKGRSGKKK